MPPRRVKPELAETRENAALEPHPDGVPGSAEGSVHPALTTRPVGLAQLELLELARRGADESIPNLDRRRALVVGHPGPTVLDELPFVTDRARAQHDEGLDGLAPLLVGHADDRDLGHRGMLEQAVLHLDGRDILAARDDDVLLAVGDGDVGAL